MAAAAAPYRVTLVCLGNICRSPMAHVVLEDRLEAAGLGDRFTVTSSGTGGWHTGDPMDPRAAATLTEAGYDASRHRARKFSIDSYAENDLILVMDHSNEADVLELAPTVEEQQKVRMYRSFDPEAGPDDLEVPDPWFGDEGGFTRVLAMVERTSDALTEHLRPSAP
ncbi:low molecular weight protein-tyrosine-phosphatase [Aeromicrobium sp. Leaf350]|uniref:low molecular weight protein-tyrosine-phosphatase n=1 Tax=Aeromicrobium sp. Leaf350 TaxID=2876565 RepID=UPI001E551BA9|nr:low molecular weight protein-tyrosine-phosphatase [Aeromicrobium sp. Leaf350]